MQCAFLLHSKLNVKLAIKLHDLPEHLRMIPTVGGITLATMTALLENLVVAEVFGKVLLMGWLPRVQDAAHTTQYCLRA